MRIPLLDTLLRRDLEEEVVRLRREVLVLRQAPRAPDTGRHEPLLVIARALRDAETVEAFADEALRVALAELGARRAAVVLERDGRLEPLAARDASGAVEPARFPLSSGIASVAAREGRVVATGKAAEDERFRSQASVARFGLESVLAVPLGRVAGCLYLEAAPEGFGAFEVETLLAAVDLIAVGLARLEREAVRQRHAQLRAIGLAAAAIAHDIGSPLSTAEFSLAVLKAGSPEDAAAIARARQACMRARDLARTMTCLATGRERPLAPRPEPLAAVVAEELALVASELGSSGIEVVQRIDSTLCAHVDRAALLRVLDNLIRNAQRAMPDGGRLELGGRAVEGGLVELEVVDSGRGIPPELLARLFELREDAPGGLGLVLVRELVERSGGSIRAESEPGRGARLVVRLPAAAPAAPPRPRREGGSALVLALGVLAVLSALGLSLVALTSIERRAASNHLDGARARLIARAGLARAAAELVETGLRDPSGAPDAPWTYPEPGTPLAAARRVSLQRAEDALSPCSGVLGGTYRAGGDRFALRIIDTSAQLDLNAPPAFLGPALDALGAAIAIEGRRRGAGARDPVSGRGPPIAAQLARCAGRATRADLERAVGSTDAALLADYVTGHACPDPLATTFRGLDVRGAPVLERTPRAPICVNTAPWPVLVAAFAGITGRDGVPVELRSACAIADRLDAHRRSREALRGPFRTWTALARFFESDLPACGLTPGQREAVAANASPFLVVAEHNPDAPALTLGSRSHVVRGTTELAIAMSGDFEVTARGIVHGPTGDVVADCREAAVVRAFEYDRHRTQADFAHGTRERVATSPRRGGAPADAGAGWVQLEPLAPRGAAGATVLDLASADRTFAKAAHDGWRIDPGRCPAVFPVGPAGADDPVSFWVKLAESPQHGLLLELARGARARLRIRGNASGDRVIVTSEVQRGGRTTVARAAVVGRAHEWHRIDVQLADGRHDLAVDDRHFLADVELPARDELPAVDAVAVGGTVTGQPGQANGTVGGVVADGALLGRDRFWAEQDLLGTYRGRFELPGPIRIGTIAWTAFRPTRWGEVEFRPDEFRIVARVRDGSVTVDERPRDGAPTRVGDDEDDYVGDDEDDVPQTPEAFSRWVAKFGLAKWKGPLPAFVTGAAATVNVLGGDGRPVPPEVVTGGSGAVPARVDYEFDFVFDRRKMRARGLEPPPVAITPVLQEVVLAYSRGARMEHLEERE